ncbi:MAG: RNA polymerase sigma factor [Solirubrobacterales bacterium]
MQDDPVRQRLGALLPRLRRFAIGLAGSPSEADDLVQSACERALAGSDAWHPGTRLDSWMFRIIQNLWIDARRRAVAQGPHLPIDHDDDLPGEDPARGIEVRSTLAWVSEAVERLPPGQRIVLQLSCFQGLTHRECAQALNLPVGTVMSRLARARATLIRRLSIDPQEAHP